jgi:hypothetical protein
VNEAGLEIPASSLWSSKPADEIIAGIRSMVAAIRDAPIIPFVPVYSAGMFAYPRFVRTRRNRNHWLAALRKFFEEAHPPCRLSMPVLKRIAKGDITAWPAQFTTYGKLEKWDVGEETEKPT